MQRKKISWVRLDLAPVEVVEVVVAEVEEGEDSLPVAEAEEVAAALLEVAVVVEAEEEAVEAEGVAGEWEVERKLSSSLTDTPGFSSLVGRRMLW